MCGYSHSQHQKEITEIEKKRDVQHQAMMQKQRKDFYLIHFSVAFIISVLFSLIGLVPSIQSGEFEFNELIFSGLFTFIFYSGCLFFVWLCEPNKSR